MVYHIGRKFEQFCEWRGCDEQIYDTSDSPWFCSDECQRQWQWENFTGYPTKFCCAVGEFYHPEPCPLVHTEEDSNEVSGMPDLPYTISVPTETGSAPVVMRQLSLVEGTTQGPTSEEVIREWRRAVRFLQRNPSGGPTGNDAA